MRVQKLIPVSQRMIRQYLYPEYYYPNASDSKMEYFKKHAGQLELNFTLSLPEKLTYFPSAQIIVSRHCVNQSLAFLT